MRTEDWKPDADYYAGDFFKWHFLRNYPGSTDTPEAREAYERVRTAYAIPAPGVFRFQPDAYISRVAEDVTEPAPDPVEWLNSLEPLVRAYDLPPDWDDNAKRWTERKEPTNA